MKIILGMVASVDGKTTQHNAPDIYHWTSKEDQRHFSTLVQKHAVIVMGRVTYEAARPVMELTPGKLRLIMTRNTEKFAVETVPGQLEFTNKSAKEVSEYLSQKGYKKILLAGGAVINTLFLKEKLVDELWLTIEPKIFGVGNPLVGSEELDVDLSLESVEKLNKQGTLLLKYQITK